MISQKYILPKFYRNLGLIFSFLSIALLILIFYLIWAKVTILITPSTEKVSQEMIFNIEESQEQKAGIVPGRILAMELEGSDIFQASGKKAVSSDIVGEVTITNNHSQEQKLVATTRLSLPENPDVILLRLKNDVTVPAGKSMKVQVYPDNVDTFTEIKPTKFIIPGLWGPLREKIYAENSEPLNKGGYVVSVLTEDDIKNAESKLKDKLYKQTLDDVNEQLDSSQTLWPRLFSSQVESSSSDAKAGQEISEFTLSMKLKATVIVFDENKLITLAENRIKEETQGKKLVGLDQKSFSYEVKNYDLENKKASVNVTFDGKVLASDIEDIDKSKLLGLTEEEVKSYFSQFSEIEGVSVSFHPSWLKKTPRIKDKIQIEISK